MYRKCLLSLTLVVCLFFGFTAGELAATGAPEVEEEKVLTIAIHADIHSLDPAAYSHRMTEGVIKSMCDGLTGWGMDMSIQPEIAYEWYFVDDLTAEYKLRNDVTFHNGDTLTAEDVKLAVMYAGKIVEKGPVPTPIDSPEGCSFHTRCFMKKGKICETDEPAPVSTGNGHCVCCHLFQSYV